MYIIGAGAQTKYVLDSLSESRAFFVDKILDPIGGMVGKKIYNIDVSIEEYSIDRISNCSTVYICVSSNYLKEKIFNELLNKSLLFPNVINKYAVISRFSEVQAGSILNAQCIIQPGVKIGIFSMIHANVLVEHDCVVGDYCNIAPGTTLCGHVNVGDYTTIGPGSTIVKNISIGKNSVVGAGSLVLRDVPDNVVAYGKPCKIVRTNLEYV